MGAIPQRGEEERHREKTAFVRNCGVWTTPRALKERNLIDESGHYTDPRFDPKSGEFPDTITVEDVLKAPPYEVFGTTRKGGFVPEAGIRLDPRKIQQAREG